MAHPYRCVVSGRQGYAIALRLTNLLDPIGRSLLLDPAVIAGLIDSGLTILEEGLAAAEEHPPEADE